jgi:hypothetical protein
VPLGVWVAENVEVEVALLVAVNCKVEVGVEEGVWV